jgi:hypothetical protein
VRLLANEQIERLPERAREVVEYRKSGSRLNHIQGCPLDCAYCIRPAYGLGPAAAPRAHLERRDGEPGGRPITRQPRGLFISVVIVDRYIPSGLVIQGFDGVDSALSRQAAHHIASHVRRHLVTFFALAKEPA